MPVLRLLLATEVPGATVTPWQVCKLTQASRAPAFISTTYPWCFNIGSSIVSAPYLPTLGGVRALTHPVPYTRCAFSFAIPPAPGVVSLVPKGGCVGG